MKNIIKQPKWKEVEYTRNQIINAGKIIRKEDSSEEEKKHAIEVIDNWREAHAFPLHVIYMHLRRMAKIDSSVIVAERLKRLESITHKLKREQSMNLWTMQDLGGCRVIVNTVDDVYKYSIAYEKSKKRHIQKKYTIISNSLNCRGIEVCMLFTNTTAIVLKSIIKICLLKFNIERICSICGLHQLKRWGFFAKKR